MLLRRVSGCVSGAFRVRLKYVLCELKFRLKCVSGAFQVGLNCV